MNKMKSNKFKIGVAVMVFSVAMALLESAVVVYLRELYYPTGFGFPMKMIPDSIGAVEIAREFATLVMLAGLGYLSGDSVKSRWGWFMIGFGIWDIFYYVFLYVFIGWPMSLSDMDILFLIPLPWFGPVYAPCLVSLALIVFGTLKQMESSLEFPLSSNRMIHGIFIVSCVIILASFTLPIMIYSKNSHLSLEQAFTSFVPTFDERLFFSGFALMLGSQVMYFIKIAQGIRNIRMPAYF